jgi:hypothetical protein
MSLAVAPVTSVFFTTAILSDYHRAVNQDETITLRIYLSTASP